MNSHGDVPADVREPVHEHGPRAELRVRVPRGPHAHGQLVRARLQGDRALPQPLELRHAEVVLDAAMEVPGMMQLRMLSEYKQQNRSGS